MNILVVSSMAWDDTNSIGNTFSNWFGGKEWAGDIFSHLYLRNQIPNNNVCRRYYHFSVFDLADPRKKSEIGKMFEGDFSGTNDNTASQKEKKIISRFHNNPSELIYFAIDEFYRHQKWNNENLDRFIHEKHPDVAFICVTDVSFLSPFIHYLRTASDAVIVSYIPDDIFGQIQKKAFYRREKLLFEFEYIIESSDIVYCASKPLTEYYSRLFHKPMKTIYKGCSISESWNDKIGKPFRLIYAGNLFYGRDFVIMKLIESIKQHNEKSDSKFFLEICSSEDVPEGLVSKMNCENVSAFRGRLPYGKVTRLIHEADASVIPESFEETNRVKTRYSFSTKIPESLMSGTNILAIGPDDISSMQFLSALPFVYYCDDINSIGTVLEKMIEDNGVIQKRKNAMDYAKSNFEIHGIREKLRGDLEHARGK